MRECKRTNQKYTDPYFDIELDLKTGRRDFLDGLGQDVDDNNFRPRGVKRVAVCFLKASLVCSMDQLLTVIARIFLRNRNFLSMARRPAMSDRARLVTAGSWQRCAH